MTDNWIKFNLVDFSEKDIFLFRVDTRDFHIISLKEKDLLKATRKEIHKEKINNKDKKYLFNIEEIKSILNRWFVETGENTSWRHFQIEDIKDLFWDFKYIDIIKNDSNAYLIRSSRSKNFLNRDIALNSKVIDRSNY